MWKKKLYSCCNRAPSLSTRTTIHHMKKTPTPTLPTTSSFLHFPSNSLYSKTEPLPSYSFSQILQTPRTIQPRFLETNSTKSFCSQAEPADKPQCWNCNVVASYSKTPFLVCDSCHSVQPLDPSTDYFQIFGLKKKYEIEGLHLEGKYKDWQKKLHPDLVHSKSQREREYAAEQSAKVIDAYRTLTNPLSRAIYLMKLEGWDVDEEERISDMELLAEIMEIREAVEEAHDAEALKQIQSQVQRKFDHWCKCFADAFGNKNHEDALASIRRMTYYNRVNDEIVKKL